MDTYTGYLDIKERIEPAPTPTKNLDVAVGMSVLSGLAMAGLSLLKNRGKK